MSKKRGTQIMALLALFGIIISLLGTGLLVIFSNNSNNVADINQELTPEQIKEIQEMIKSNTGNLVGTGEVNETQIDVGTGETK